MSELLLLLDQIRAVAVTGLNYTDSHYDRERYERLLALVNTEYASLTDLPEAELNERFRRELGYMTPKVGVDAAIFDDAGRILLVKRSDDLTWCLPCGWAEIGLTPEENVRREVLEETGLHVEVRDFIEVKSFTPTVSSIPHAGYSLLYHCVVIGGRLTPSEETLDVGYFDHAQVTNWHPHHRIRAERAYQYWLTKVKIER